MGKDEQITNASENKKPLNKILSFAKESIIVFCATIASSVTSITLSKALPKIGTLYLGEGWRDRYDTLLYTIDLFVMVPLAIFGGAIVVYFFRWRNVGTHEGQQPTYSDPAASNDEQHRTNAEPNRDEILDWLYADDPKETEDESGVVNWNTDNPYEILNLDTSASASDIKTAYHALIIQYHPDKFSSHPPDFQKLADERTKKINWAYSECLKRVA